MAKYSMVVQSKAVDGRDDDYNTWYDNQHFGDICAIPGVTGGRRLEQVMTVAGEPGLKYLAIYDIERSDDREFVGRVYGTEFRGAVGLRYGLLKIVLANSPLDVVLKGSEILEELELLASGASLGVVRQSEKDRTAYVIRSAAGERVVQLGSSDARLEHDGSVLRFGLQIDLARIPNFLAIFSRKAQANPNVVFEPRIPFPDAALMMALVLSVRMIYRRFDFNNT